MLADASGDILGDQNTLIRRVPTRWNSEKDCVDSHVNLRPVIESMTGNSANKLAAFKLTDHQWNLTIELKDVLNVNFPHPPAITTDTILQLFKAPTLLFSQAELPLVSQTIPMLQELEDSLALVRDCESLPNVLRVAAHASLMLAEKYHSLNDECEVYRIAIGTCFTKNVGDYFVNIF